MEIEELQSRGKIKPQGCNRRYDLFLKIKYPNTEFYRGGWGPEILHFVDDGPYRGKVGKIFCSYGRYSHIARWFLDTMFESE